MQHSHAHRQGEKGQILLLAIVFFGLFFTITTTLVGGLIVFVKSERYAVAKSQALSLAEAGIDKAVYELNQNPSYNGETNTALGEGAFTTTVSTIDTNTRLISVTASVPSTNPVAQRTVKARVGLNSDIISFHYGMQAGNGGITLNNSSQIVGNVFSSGPVIGAGGNMVYGSVVSAGASGLVYGIRATSSVFAHTIGGAKATVVDGNAYYATSITNTTVNGTSYPNSSDLPPADFPISDEQILEWEQEAEDGGVINTCNASGNYEITTSQTLGPIKINCNLVIKSTSGILTVTGPIWVTGNITTQTGPTIQIDGSLGSQNVAIIAHNPMDETGSGIISISQSTAFNNSGSANSFVFLVSQNKSAEQGGAVTAISLNQGASALVAYASHGRITMGQSVSVKEATGYKIELSQSASVTYDTGLPSTVFQSGPGGGWAFVPGSYAVFEY